MSAQIRAKLTPEQRLQLIERVLSDGASISQACKAFGVSRPTFYKWNSKYDSQASYEENLRNLSDQPRSIAEPLNKTPTWVEGKIRKLVLASDPNTSKYDLYDRFLYKFPDSDVGLHGFYNTLVRLHLNTPWLRKRFIFSQSKSQRAWADGFSASERLRVVERVLRGGLSVSSVANELGISRVTLHNWISRYREASAEARLDVLARHKPRRDYWPRQATEEQGNWVLQLVAQFPEASKYELADLMRERYEGRALGSHGIYNILRRHGLTRQEQRIEWASALGVSLPSVRPAVSWQDRLKQVWEQFLPTRAPAPPPQVSFGILLRPSLTRLKCFSPYFLFSLLFLFGLYEWGRILGSATTIFQALGWFFASVALSMGTVFFLYSLKYYFTLAVVLSFSREGGEEDFNIRPISRQGFSRSSSGLSGLGLWLGNLFGLRIDARQADPSTSLRTSGLEPDLGDIKLERYPFISIHLPMYNEKRVAERILKACTSFDYQRYEIIVADDSTDETTAIVERFAEQWNAKLRGSTTISSSDLERERLDLSGPMIKVIHRETREGFKGGALKEALKHTDPRAEFIVVFDADFVPYPDTLELFLKYFQTNAGSLNPKRYSLNPIAAIQGYQWHVLNKSENWITRGVRSEYAGSYVIERSGEELYGGLKQIAGSVYMIRRDLVDRFGWGTSLTEDFQLTLRLYEAGYKVVYTPYIQAPSECVSTLKRLIRQRMRWAEGHSFNIRRMFTRLLFGKWEDPIVHYPLSNVHLNSKSSNSQINGQWKMQNGKSVRCRREHRRWRPSSLSVSEKLEFFYLSPYYLQAFFFLVGTISWLLSETIFRVRLPFWTAVWGWSLVLTNILSLPLMNTVGLFLEEAEERDYLGILAFTVLTYCLAPFQAYASLKGFIQREEGPWFRTPKTGRITDVFRRGRFYRFVRGFFPGRVGGVAAEESPAYSLVGNAHAFVQGTANNQFNSSFIRPRRMRWVSKVTLAVLLVFSITVYSATRFVPIVYAAPFSFYLHANAASGDPNLTGSWLAKKDPAIADETADTSTSVYTDPTDGVYYQWQPGVSSNATQGTPGTSATGKGWIADQIYDSTFFINSGTWEFKIRVTDDNAAGVVSAHVRVYRVALSGGSVLSSTEFFNYTDSFDLSTGSSTDHTFTTGTVCSPSCVFTDAEKYLLVEYWAYVVTGFNKETLTFEVEQAGTSPYQYFTTQTIVPEKVIFYIATAPFIPMIAMWARKRQIAISLGSL